MILAASLLLDAALGEPRWIWDRLPHPAVLMGRLVGRLDARLNRGRHRRAKGVLATAALTLAAGLTGLAVQSLGWLPTLLLTAVLLAHRSLVVHVRDVARALQCSTPEGRRAVARIVGRDTAAMDPPAIARAAIESAAENFSDGVVAPAFWFLLAGLPGLMICKAVNTADSMIGYRTPRHDRFGWAAARLDDALNWIPARLTAILIAVAAFRPDARRTVLRDAPLHRSPNAGWPEAAMAAVLDVALSGPRAYEGRMQPFPFVHPEGRRAIGPDEILAATRILWRAWALLLGIVLVWALV